MNINMPSLEDIKKDGRLIRYIKQPSEAVKLIAKQNLFPVTIEGNYITIGCQTRTKEQWLQLSDKELIELGGEDAPFFKSELLKKLEI